MSQFKPMLAALCEDTSRLHYPVLASPKLDGVRAVKLDGVLVSRTLKPIPSPAAQFFTSRLPDGIDGELIVGPPNKDPYRRTVSAVMSHDDATAQLHYHIFDNFKFHSGFQFRLTDARKWAAGSVIVVPHTTVFNEEHLLELEAQYVGEGYEGLMIRSVDGPYKFGRSTVREEYLLKLKRYRDSEAEIVGFYEKLHNDNEAKTNALGHTERSTKKEGMVPTGVLGGFHVRDIHSGVEFSVGGGFTDAQREAYWDNRLGLFGLTIVYKYFALGSKERPRFPVFKGFRDPIDIGEPK